MESALKDSLKPETKVLFRVLLYKVLGYPKCMEDGTHLPCLLQQPDTNHIWDALYSRGDIPVCFLKQWLKL